LGGGLSGRVERLADLFHRAGVAAEPRIDVLADLWEKFLMVCATSGVSALTRVTLGEVLACPEALELVRGLLVEGEAVARASRVGLSSDVVERLVGLLRGFTPAARASMYYDVLAGRRLELEALSGAMVRRGRERGVPTPLNFAVYALLKPYADGAA
jgi:2-dehydropantoate 2-reductase